MTALQRLSFSTVFCCTTAVLGAWDQLASIPDKNGVAAPFAGVSGQTLLVAGGANFPDKAPWDNGKKVWYDTVYSLGIRKQTWTTAGKLPRPIAYGVSVNWNNRIVCVGGSDIDHCYADAFFLDLDHGKVRITSLPPLPTPIANGCAACVGNLLYVAGGQISNDATTAVDTVFQIDLSEPKSAWKSIPPIPGGGRILATAAAFDGSFYVIGGIALSAAADHSAQRKYLADVYQFTLGSGWKRMADLPHTVAAAPSPAATDDTGIMMLGGDDGSHLGFKPVVLHPGFSKAMLHFDPRANAWADAGETPAARVTVPCVKWGDGYVITSGEMRPGVRSPQIWMFNPGDSR